uniref:Leucine-rich repeat-containing N-terminal plant-type domain-containing protein n=1 Tax=Ananas comosus var. bracteatus TaxID=296719 RepID=A0A6V7PE19_ANACO|nr:unnamed protein product [Ananas comosus var. bracteatus]
MATDSTLTETLTLTLDRSIDRRRRRRSRRRRRHGRFRHRRGAKSPSGVARPRAARVVGVGQLEGDALYALRRSLSDPDNVLQSWDPTLVNPCTWFHITCNQDNRVTRVDLGNSNFIGHLVSELGRLEHLQYL